MRPFNYSAGTTLVFAVISEDPEQAIVDVNFKESALKTAVDDTGKDLLNAGADEVEMRKRREFWSAVPSISADHKVVLIETDTFHPLALAAPDACRITVTGDVALLTARGQTEASAEFSLKEQGSFEVENLRFILESIDPEGGFGDTPYELEFRVYGPMDRLKDIQFLDSAGQVIKRHSPLDPAHHASGDEEFHFLRVRLAEAPPEAASMKLVLWNGISQSTLPVEVTYSLSLQPVAK